MNKNTEAEKELLQALYIVEDLLNAVKNKEHRNITAEDKNNMSYVQSKAKLAYPHVREFNNSLDCCKGSGFINFANDMVPVFDRLKAQHEAEVAEFNERVKEHLDAVENPDVIVGSVEYNRQNVNEVNPFNPIGHDDVEQVKDPVKKAGRRKKG